MIATYDNMNSHIAGFNDYVDYSKKEEEKKKNIRRVRKIEKRPNTESFSCTDFMGGVIFGCMLLLLIVGYGSWILELI